MKKWLVLICFFIAIIVLYCCAVFFAGEIAQVKYGNPIESETLLSRAGQFGDSAGAVNALFAALAFFGVLCTLFWQISDSKEQKKLLRLNVLKILFFKC